MLSVVEGMPEDALFSPTLILFNVGQASIE
jgi:hypothetical protein